MRNRGVVEERGGVEVWGEEFGLWRLWGLVLPALLLLYPVLLGLLPVSSTVAQTSLSDAKLYGWWWLWAVNWGFNFRLLYVLPCLFYDCFLQFVFVCLFFPPPLWPSFCRSPDISPVVCRRDADVLAVV